VSFRDLLARWPVVKQIQTGGDGTGPEAMSCRTSSLGPRTAGAEVARSVCPYCGVGCGQLIYHKNNKLVSIEGDPESPISRGRLCPKGADSYELLTHANRELKVKYRKPFSKKWESLDLETAMDMIADRLWEARERSFVEKQDGQTLMQTTTIAHLGGATRKCLLAVWGWCASATRPEYDTAPRCPVWAHHTDEAEQLLRSRTCNTLTPS
jgi:formate dehydrogenase major subunit